MLPFRHYSYAIKALSRSERQYSAERFDLLNAHRQQPRSSSIRRDGIRPTH